MQRRTFLKTLASSGAVVAVTGGGYVWLRPDGQSEPLTVSTALRKMDALDPETIQSTGAWTPFQIFSHIAQSIEYSIAGFPEMKSEFFQKSVGALAFGVFARRGAMSHSLSEPIPGAPLFSPDGGTQQGLDHLRRAFLQFDQHPGALAPHFAYGPLDREEYAAAHVMHLNNHLEEIIT